MISLVNQEYKTLKLNNNVLNNEYKKLIDSKFFIPYKICHGLKLKIKK